MSPHDSRMALLNLAGWGVIVYTAGYALGMALRWSLRALRRLRRR